MRIIEDRGDPIGAYDCRSIEVGGNINLRWDSHMPGGPGYKIMIDHGDCLLDEFAGQIRAGANVRFVASQGKIVRSRHDNRPVGERFD